MVIGVQRRAVGVFSTRRDAENALYELRNSGFAMDRVSVIAQDVDRNDSIAGSEVREKVGDKSDEGATVGALSGGAVGGLTGLLVGLGLLAIPGIGPIMLAGATATTLATTLAGAGIGAAAGSLVGALIGLGIPEERARVYNERVGRGHYLVIVDGTEAEIAKAEAILRRGGIEEFEVYDHPNTRPGDVTTTTPVTGVAPKGVTHTRKRAIGAFPHRRDAEAALTELRDAGFSMNQVSLLAKHADSDHNIAGVAPQTGVGNKADEGAKAGAVTGGALGGLGGLLVGLGALAIPGIGPVIAGGATATALATALTGGALGAAAGGIAGGLVGLGIPENKARVYSDRLNRGDYLVIVEGTDDEVRRAEAILKRHGIQEFEIFDHSDFKHPRTDVDTTPVSGVAYNPTGVSASTVGTGIAYNPGDVTTTTPVSGITNTRRRAIGVFPHRRDAEAALTELRDAGFSMNQVSLIAKDGNTGSNVAGVATPGVGNKADEGAKAGAVTGGALGGLGGLLVGLGALAIPGIGPVIAGGAVATALATSLAGGAIGAAAGGITGGLVGLGIPENKARAYSDRLNRGDYLVIVDGTDDEIRHAEAILKRHGVQDFDTFDATDVSGVRHQTPVVNTTDTNYVSQITHDDPAVIIIDRRDER
nr:general stress protein [Iningainema tapete]